MLATILPQQTYSVRTSHSDADRQLSYANLLAMRSQSVIKLWTTTTYETILPGRKRPDIAYEHAGEFKFAGNWRRRGPGLLIAHGFIATYNNYFREEMNHNTRLMLVHKPVVEDVNFYIPRLSLIVKPES